VTELNKAGDLNSLGHVDIPQGEFREQIDVVADELRQLAGNADVPSDPLNAPYILYVNPYTGSDVFVGGQYTTTGDLERRISNQRLECGYTEARPFKTINRAALEAAIVTSRNYLNDAAKQKALVTIVLCSGEHVVRVARGKEFSSSNFPELSDGADFDVDKLNDFNDHETGGVILPRGCSLISLDLRKTVVRPGDIPTQAAEFPDYSNRRSIFKVTGGGYYYGITFKDKKDQDRSHHLMHCFEFASEEELDRLYQKVLRSFSTADINAANTKADETEYQIVGPLPPTPSEPTDTVASASPYIYNCSIRSTYGLGGIFADGSKVQGFRSMVVAQFTGVSLQRDMDNWELYTGNQWRKVQNYDEYINADPNDVRPRPGYKSFHVRAVNKAVIQEVSVFAIGQAIHHWTESGGELTITNSNSNFGGCAALAEGFRDEAVPADKGWYTVSVRSPLDPLGADATPVRRRINIGNLSDSQADTATTLTLSANLQPSQLDENQPAVVTAEGYTLKENDYIFVENPAGPDYRAQLTASPWNGTNQIRIKTALYGTTEDENGNTLDGAPGSSEAFQSLEGLVVYIRRIVDTRDVTQRRCSILISGANESRLPTRDYVLQPPNVAATWDGRNSAVASSEADLSARNGARIILRNTEQQTTTFDENTYYRKQDVVVVDEKHFVATGVNYQKSFADGNWSETYVHMEEDYSPEGFYKNSAPVIIFDKDTDPAYDSATLGNRTSDAEFLAQTRSAVDFLGAYNYLRNTGFNNTQANNALGVHDEADRDTALGGEDVEMRRPSNIRLFGHAWEWAGYLNYTKAMPDYQGTLLPQNKFTYYFTNQSGGKVYANGFNEEGLQVSPRGLEDITTGEVLSISDVAAPDRPATIITEIEGSLEVKGDFKANSISEPKSSTGTFGVCGLAKKADYESTKPVSNISNSDLDQESNKVVTITGLNYWKNTQNILTANQNFTIYVAPDNAVLGSEVNFDGDVTELAYDPGRADIIEEFPDSAARAVYFSKAIQYFNNNVSSGTTITYILGNGAYYNRPPAFGHVANVLGARQSVFVNNNQVNPDYAIPGNRPSTKVRWFIDNSLNKSDVRDWHLPIFATAARIAGRFTIDSSAYAYSVSYQLNFRFGGAIEGCCWLGAAETYTQSVFPNSIYNFNEVNPDNPVRGRASTLNAAIDLAISEQANENVPAGDPDKSTNFRAVFGDDTIRCATALVAKNCIFGPKLANFGREGFGGPGPIFRTIDDCNIDMKGIYFMGSHTAEPGAYPRCEGDNQINIDNDVYGTTHSGAVIDGFSDAEIKAQSVSVTFNFAYAFSPENSKERWYNYDVNCLHFLNSNGEYANNDTTIYTVGAEAGPAFEGFIGRFSPGSTIALGSSRTFDTFREPADKDRSAGIAGQFGGIKKQNVNGNPDRVENRCQGIIYQDMDDINGGYYNAFGIPVVTFARARSDFSSLFVKAITGEPIVGGTVADDNEGIAFAMPPENEEAEAFNLTVRKWNPGVHTKAGADNNSKGNPEMLGTQIIGQRGNAFYG